jgi:leucine dehydrogenase
VGVDLRDVAVMGRTTRHVSQARGGSGRDTAELTARGALAAIRAAARELGLELDGLRVALQGLGQVGYGLLKMLGAAGARVTVTDIDPARAERAVSELGVEAVEPDAIFEVEADVFSPNAVGGVLDAETIPRLRARAIAGGADLPVADERSGDLLHERNALYAPDVLAGAGGLLALAGEVEGEGPERTARRVGEIGDRLVALWRQSREEDVPVHRLASKRAEEKLAAAHERESRG